MAQPTDFMIEGATTLDAASWEGSGFVANAKLCTARGAATVAGSDQSANAIDFWWVVAPFAGVIGSSSTPAVFQVDDTYNADPNFAYSPAGGQMYAKINVSGISQPIPEVLVGGRGQLFLQETEEPITTFRMTSGRCVVGQNAEYTNLYMSGGELIADSVSGAAATLNQIEGGVFTTYRAATTTEVNGVNARAILMGDGKTYTTVNVRNGTVKWHYGNGTTVNVYRNGVLDLSDVKDAVSIGTVNIHNGGRVIDINNPLVDITTVNYVDSLGGGGFATGGSP